MVKDIDEKKCLYLVYEELTYGGDVCEGEENDRFPNHNPTHTEWKPIQVCRQHPGGFSVEQLDIDPSAEAVFILVVRYSSGDTFGTGTGYWSIIGTFLTEEEVIAKEKEVTSDSYSGYKVWEGYFERLEGFEVHHFKVTDSVNEIGHVVYH